MCIELFKRVHGHDTGHFGYAKIFLLFIEHFYWHGMSEELRGWLKCCALCQKVKPGDVRGKYPLAQEIAGSPMVKCGVDLSGPCPLSREGNCYLCVWQDYFFKWIEEYAMPDKTAISVAKCLVNFMGRYGCFMKLQEFLILVKSLWQMLLNNCVNSEE